MSFDMERIRARLLDELVDGIGLYLGDKAQEYVRRYFYDMIEKNLKQYSKGAILVGMSLLDQIFPQVSEIKYIGDWLGLWGRLGVKDIISQVVDKPPYCLAEDSNTIHCFNFADLSTLDVAIDGTKLTANTDYTVSGTESDFTISLANALASGEHDIRVADSRVAFYGKIKV